MVVCLDLLLVLTGATSVAFGGASTPPPPPSEAEPDVPFDRHRMLAHLARHVMLPTYMAFAAATQDLHKAATQFCEAPTAAPLAAAQAAWKRAVVLWKHSEAYHLGPTTGLAMAIDFWPTRPRIIHSVMRSSQPLTAETIAFAGTAAQGLPAIEYLLFDPASGYQAIVAHDRNAVNATRYCAYLVAAAEHLAQQAQFVASTWSPEGANLVAQLAQAGQGSETYASVHEAISEVVNRLLVALEKVKNDKLGKPLYGNGRTPWPKRTEAWRSNHSLANLQNNLRGLYDVYTGTHGTTNGPGFDDYLAALGSDLGQRITRQFQVTFDAVHAIPAPLQVAVVDHPQAVEAAYQEVKMLLILLKVEMTNLLSITVDFSDNDGD
jgi:uncharacterized protein